MSSSIELPSTQPVKVKYRSKSAPYLAQIPISFPFISLTKAKFGLLSNCFSCGPQKKASGWSVLILLS